MSCDVLLKEKKLLPESNNARLLPQTVAIDEDPVIKKKRSNDSVFSEGNITLCIKKQELLPEHIEHSHSDIQGSGNIEPTTGHFDLFSLLSRSYILCIQFNFNLPDIH